jgi:hypothetical protein
MADSVEPTLSAAWFIMTNNVKGKLEGVVVGGFVTRQGRKKAAFRFSRKIL